MSKISRRPPAPSTAEEFIDGALNLPEPVMRGDNDQGPYPWEDPKVRSDVFKGFNLRLPEPYLLKLRFVAKHSPHSMQGFIHSVLLPAIDKELAAITGRSEISD